MDNYEQYSEREVLEIVRSASEKIWNICLLMSLDYLGKITEGQAITEYGRGSTNYLQIKKRFHDDRRRMLRIIRYRQGR